MKGQNYGKGAGLYELVGFLKTEDWDRIFDTRFEYWKIAEAIELECERTGAPIKEVTKKYYEAYFKKSVVAKCEECGKELTNEDGYGHDCEVN